MPIVSTDPVPILRTGGDPRERGREHGALAGERIERGISRYMERFRHFSGFDRQAAREEALRYVDPILEYDPEIVDEIRGVAEGAAVPFADVLAMNCRSELMFASARIMECSSFALQPSVTADQHTYVGQNWDWAPDISETIILLFIGQEDPKPDILLLDEAGIVGRMGLNSAGIGLCTNTLISDFRQHGVPYNVLLRGVLNHQGLDGAIAALVRPARAIPANFVIGDGRGQTIDIEVAPREFDYIYPTDGIITHGNHFSGTRMRLKDVSVEKWPDSLYRECRIRDVLQPHSGEISVETMQEALRDRFGFPNSVSRHADPEQGEFDQLETIASIIIDCTDRQCWIAVGPPDRTAYAEYAIADFELAHVERAPAER
jgi:isopenicillin-N N-acyltransferase-like protein